MIVLDASVAVQWFVAETGSAQARQLLNDRQGSIAIPDIFVVEVAATLVREANANKADGDYYRGVLGQLLILIERGALHLHPMPPDQIVAAGHLAIDLGHPLKDCIYLALAMALDGELITADARFAAKARGVYPMVRVLGE